MRLGWTLALLAVVLVTLPGGPAGVADGSPPLMSFTRHVPPAALPNVGQAAEPTIGVDWRTGAVMFQARSTTLRVQFDDLASPPVATWTDRSPPSSIVNVDPILFVDPVTGRTFAGGLDGACSVLSLSDDDGESWSPIANSCSGADHPSIVSGPWAEPRPVAAIHPRAVYYCAQASVAQCARSLDGGFTFGPGVTVPCVSVAPGLHGSVHIGPDGRVYLPFRTCGGSNGVSVSRDNGLSWTSRPIPGAASPALGFDPDVATTTSGHAWVAYPTRAYGVGMARSVDGGAAWTTFGDVAAPAGVLSATFVEAVAGDDGRAAVAYLGSTTDGAPHEEGFPGTWHLYVTYTLDDGASWTTVRATENVVHRGWICSAGPTCTGGRNLLDFMDAQLDAHGRIVVGYADGCSGACELNNGPSISAYAAIARQAGGPTMFSAWDPEPDERGPPRVPLPALHRPDEGALLAPDAG